MTAVAYWPVDNPGARGELKFISGQTDGAGDPSVLLYVPRLSRGVDWYETYTFAIVRGEATEIRTVQVMRKLIGLVAIIGGATAALSTLITPAKGPAADHQEERAPAQENGDLIAIRPPSLTDLFEESNGYGDISRYQSLVICAATAVVLMVSFFDTWRVPDIPSQVLQLLGTSLAVYLGVKGIRVVKEK